MFRIIIVFILAIFPTISYCSSVISTDHQKSINLLVKQAKEKELSKHPYWLNLLHYKKKNSSQFESEVISKNFFNSPSGRNNSDNELYATMAAFFKPPGKHSNDHAQCRFIARYNWLRSQLNWEKIDLPAIKCNKFNEWSMHGHIKSLSLIYATGYLGNPASFYGHLLLKLNPDRNNTPTDLLDQSINFGAIVPDNEHPLIYVLNGIFGGYTSSFSNNKFYRHNHIYIENEFRDMWEYELALTSKEVEQLLFHSWELMNSEFTYYFMKENCAYRMAELLELVIDEPLISKKHPWSIPSDVFEHLASINRNNIPLIKKTTRIPSRQSRFYTNYLNLNPLQKQIINKLIDTDLQFNEIPYQALVEDQKISIINTIIDYLDYRIINEKTSDDLTNLRYKTLIERSKLKADNNKEQSEDNTAPPHTGPLPTMLRTGLIYNNKFNNGIEFNFRPAYFDTLNIDKSRIKNSTLTMLDLKVAYINNEFELRAFDIVNIETLNTSVTGLPGDRPFSWKIKFGLESQDLECLDCTISKFTGGLGKSLSVGSQTTVFGLIELFAQNEYENSGTLGSTASFNIIGYPTSWWKSKISYAHKVYLNGDESNTPIFQWTNRFGKSRQWDIRLEYIDNVAQEAKLGLSLYW